MLRRLRCRRRLGLCRLNTAPLFAETSRRLVSARGRVGLVVPTGIATDSFTQYFFRDVVEGQNLVSLYDFKNNDRLFYDVGHRRTHFSLLTLTGVGSPANNAVFVFSADRTEDLDDPDRRFTLTAADIELLNPNTRTCPVFRTRRDAEITKAIYRRMPVLVRDGDPEASPWAFRGLIMFQMNTDSYRFRTRSELESDGWTLTGNVFVRDDSRMLPLYEAKMVHQFDHHYGDYAMRRSGSQDTQLPDVPPERLDDPQYAPLPRYWVDEADVRSRLSGRWGREWLLGWRDICRATDERTCIASIIPLVAVGGTYLLAFPGGPAEQAAALAAVLTSFVFDYVARQMVGGTHLNQGVMRQLPVPTPAMLDLPRAFHPGTPLTAWLRPRVLELAFTADDLAPFAADLGYSGPPFRWDPERRFLMRAELNAACFHLYGIDRDDVDYILDTFPIVKRNDERAHGEYRTKRVILEVFDAMDAAANSGLRYELMLDPPPADPRLAHSQTVEVTGRA